MKYSSILDKIRSLRSKGLTYSEIQRELGLKIPKSTLSYLCRGVRLPDDYQQKIEKLSVNNALRAQIIAVIANRKRREQLLRSLRERGGRLVDSLDLNALKTALALLYLGEGAKWRGHAGLALGSSDPEIIKLYIRLLRKCYGITEKQLKCRVSYRADQDLNALKRFWSKITGIALENFYKSKPDPRTLGRPTKRKDYHGVCVISCAGTEIQLELEAIAKALIQRLGP